MIKRIFFILIINCIIIGNIERVSGQNQSKADSFKMILKTTDTLTLSSKLFILEKIATFSSSPDDKLFYADKLLNEALKNNHYSYIIIAHHIIGLSYRLQGKLERSLEYLFQSAKLADNKMEYTFLSKVYLEIAATYAANNNPTNALYYNEKAIEIIRNYGNSEQLAINLLNTGFSYYKLNILDSALSLYNEAEPIFNEIDLPIGTAYVIGNRALVYWKNGHTDKAITDLLKTIEMLQPLGDKYGMADYHNQLGTIFLEQNNIEKTIYHTQRALNMAMELGLKEQIRDASFLLAQLYNQKNNYKKAFNYQTQYIAYKDSVENSDQTKRMANMRTEFEVNLREKEIDLLEKKQILNKTYIAIVIILLILSVVVILLFRQRLHTSKVVAENLKIQHEKKIKDMLNEQQNKALQAMIEGRDRERKRLAKELHNHLGSLMATVKVNLNGIEENNSPKYQTISTLIDQACTDIRNMSHSLNMGVSENFGLIPALKELVTNLQQSGEFEIEFSAAMCNCQLELKNEITIYRIVQELVSNALKHSKASKLSVLLTFFEEDKLVNIIVDDNGIGFNIKDANKNSNGIGLNSIKEMVSNKNGTIQFDSNSKIGTSVNIDLPIIKDVEIS